MKLTPINMAEAIFEPFWDPELSGLAEWEVDDGRSHGLKVYQNWCFVIFDWTAKPARGPALHMSRRLDLDCSGYDRLIISVMAPERSVFRLSAATDAGLVSFTSPPSPPQKKEYAIDLKGAARIESITLDIETMVEGPATGWFNWIGLQDSVLLERYLGQWKRFDDEWAGYLKPDDFEPRFEPTLGIVIDSQELARLRAEHDAHLKRHGQSPFTLAAAEATSRVPERMISDFVNFWGDTRYCRERDYGSLLLANAPGSNAALAGLLLKDRTLLRLAARYAMAIAMCDRWDDGMICYFPGGTFEHRCFVQSLCVHEAALILDLAGEMFTDLGRNYVLRRIAEEGMGSINFNTWKHEYIFHMNQLAWFTPGRMLGYLTLERYWKHVEPFTEIAYQNLLENLEDSVLPDGGYVEGPTYFRCVARDGGLPLYYYARARGKDFKSILPQSMKRTAPFAEALASTDASADVIPICDGRPHMEQEAVAVMAALLPESQWVSIFHKTMARSGGMAETVLAWQLSKQVPAKEPERAVFTFLPDMGVMSSVRRLRGDEVRLFIMGNKAGAGHTHEDKGSFVLEFAGETFAMDPGTCDYGHPLSFTLKTCLRHNMLVPSGLIDRPHPASPLPADVKPKGEGNNTSVHASIDATAGWEGYYRKWVRTWDSPTPDVLTITDDYEIVAGDGVDFLWSTQRDVDIKRLEVVVKGVKGQIVISVPEGCSVHLDDLPLIDSGVQRCICIHKPGLSGRLQVAVKLGARQ